MEHDLVLFPHYTSFYPQYITFGPLLLVKPMVSTSQDTLRSRDAPAVPTRSAQRSSSAPTTPHGVAPRRSASGEPAQRSATPRRSRAKLFDVAQPLLQPGIPKEQLGMKPAEVGLFYDVHADSRFLAPK